MGSLFFLQILAVLLGCKIDDAAVSL